jgi:hypothetical protein
MRKLLLATPRMGKYWIKKATIDFPSINSFFITANASAAG